LKAAGCAAGFGDGSFGYNSPVTRGQDAIFQMACAPGAAYKSAGASPTAVALTPGSPTVIQSDTITAGINPGGVQVLLVHVHATMSATAALAPPVTATPILAVTPPAGGTASSPSVQCLPATVNPGLSQPETFDCDGGFVVPTGQSLSITFSATVGTPPPGVTVTITPGTLSAWTTPRGNTVSSTTSLS
jgi:hypothetical protein